MEREPLNLELPLHNCSIDIEAYECPICSIGLDDDPTEEQKETKPKEGERIQILKEGD
jgi:hypothetical protein